MRSRPAIKASAGSFAAISHRPEATPVAGGIATRATGAKVGGLPAVNVPITSLRWIRPSDALGGLHEGEHFGDLFVTHGRWCLSRAGARSPGDDRLTTRAYASLVQLEQSALDPALHPERNRAYRAAA
jgi:hypothetical protein